MTGNLTKYMLPARFIERYRPVRSHRHERVLDSYFFDPHVARFFIRMATLEPIPPRAVWTVVLPESGSGPCRIVSGQREERAIGYVICQISFAAGDDLEYPLVRKLTYSARLRISTLQCLLDDLAQAGQLAAGSEIAGLIQRRIEELRA
jgi:hypothetical protein